MPRKSGRAVSIELLISICGIYVRAAWKRGRCETVASWQSMWMMYCLRLNLPCALDAIASIWECSKPEQATCQQSITFCGFEIQQNDPEQGGGYRLHQHSYEVELVKKWEITDVRHQLDFKLPTPEEEAELQRSDDVAQVRKAQACTGALLWLATRTRPEISLGVSAMSRFCTKSPELTISIGMKIMA